MNDTEILNWIAEHMIMFKPLVVTARMSYIDNNGETHDAVYRSENANPSCIEQLRGCVEMVTKK
jgi:hypothetical protein